MKICFRDDLGLVTMDVDMDNTAGVGFDGQYAYFNDVYGRDYRIPVKDIVMIGKEE